MERPEELDHTLIPASMASRVKQVPVGVVISQTVAPWRLEEGWGEAEEHRKVSDLT